MSVEALGHLAGDGAGALEGAGRGIRAGGVFILERPVDLSGLVGAGEDGDVEDVRDLGGGGADEPGLLDLELALGHFGWREAFDLEVLDGSEALVVALDGIGGDAGAGESFDDGAGGLGPGVVGGVLVAAVDEEADVDDGDVGHGADALGGGDGDGAVLFIDLNGLGGSGRGESEGGQGGQDGWAKRRGGERDQRESPAGWGGVG